ncbi:hypothetical protein BCS7_16455 [Pectobacterium odoriferum]|nr:hypothetical protein BCS7_16455 [Pectobacterium odoriferum]
MNQNDCSGKTLKPWPIFVDHYRQELFNATMIRRIAEASYHFALFQLFACPRITDAFDYV